LKFESCFRSLPAWLPKLTDVYWTRHAIFKVTKPIQKEGNKREGKNCGGGREKNKIEKEEEKEEKEEGDNCGGGGGKIKFWRRKQQHAQLIC